MPVVVVVVYTTVDKSRVFNTQNTIRHSSVAVHVPVDFFRFVSFNFFPSSDRICVHRSLFSPQQLVDCVLFVDKTASIVVSSKTNLFLRCSLCSRQYETRAIQSAVTPHANGRRSISTNAFHVDNMSKPLYAILLLAIGSLCLLAADTGNGDHHSLELDENNWTNVLTDEWMVLL